MANALLRWLMRRAWLNLVLFIATAASIFVTYRYGWGGESGDAALFAACVMLIVGAHEMGHYTMARHHGVESSLPYFIPLPFVGLFGTLGAVIRLRGRVPHKDALVDIGAAGPLAGMVMALPILAVGLALSTVDVMPQAARAAAEHFPPQASLWGMAAYVGQLARSWVHNLPEPVWADGSAFNFGDNLLSLLAARLWFGAIPAGHEVYAHPVFLAGWFGMLLTMLNMMPVGQLDGGHLTFAWFGARAEDLGHLVAGVLLLLAIFFSSSWVVWFLMLRFVVGFKHPPVVEEDRPLSFGRKVVCLVSFVVLALTFMPLPLEIH